MNKNLIRRGTNINWREISYIIISGGIGGLLSCIYACTIGQPIALALYEAIPFSMVLGAGASFLGVYLLANSDTRDMIRCIAFALACGFLWKPVYDASRALINQSIQQREEKTAMELFHKSTSMVAELPMISVDQLPAKINEVANTSVELIRSLPKIKTTDTREELVASANDAISAINEIALKRPEEATFALKELGEASFKSGELKITNSTITYLADLSQDLMQPLNIRNEALLSTADLSAQLLRDYKIDIYYEKDSADDEEIAKKIRSIITSQNLSNRIVLAPRPRDFFEESGLPRGNEVRYEIGKEDEAAQALKTVINLIDSSLNFQLRPAVTSTPGTLSLFIWKKM